MFSKAALIDISDEYACYGSLDGGKDLGSEAFCIDLGNRTEIWSAQSIDAETDIGPWLDAEVDAGMAWVSPTSTEQHLPQLFNYHNHGGIDFEKGCYLGQEIIARAHYRGELKWRLHRLDSDRVRETGEALDIGTIVASAPSGALAILKNSTEDTVTAIFEDGEEVAATPCE